MAKKIDNAAFEFLSKTHKAEPVEPTNPIESIEPIKNIEHSAEQVPDGYVLRREPKSAKIQLLVRESTKKKVQKIAKKEKTSVNNLINIIIEKYINEREM